MRRILEYLGYVFLAGALGFMLWRAAPRVAADLLHGDGFVPASSAHATQIRCRTYAGFFANSCTITYVLAGSRAEHELEDFRFGWAPDGPYQLLQHRDVASRLTTNVSLATIWNRLALVLVFGGFGLVAVVAPLASLRRRSTG